MAEIPILLLAAGASSRMGQPKQLLPWGKQTLIEHQIQVMLKTTQPVFVVVGAFSELVLSIVQNYPIQIVINDNWEQGMGTSLSLGISHVKQKFPDVNGVLITLLDQPLIATSYLQKMLDVFQSGSRQIIVSQSASGWTGVPVLFDEYYFSELSELKSDEGAKKIIKRHEENLILLDGDELLEDIDTPETYQQLLKKYLNSSS